MILKDYLKKLKLNEKLKFEQFIKKYRNVTINAKRKIDDVLNGEYYQTDHRKVSKKNKINYNKNQFQCSYK